MKRTPPLIALVPTMEGDSGAAKNAALLLAWAHRYTPHIYVLPLSYRALARPHSPRLSTAIAKTAQIPANLARMIAARIQLSKVKPVIYLIPEASLGNLFCLAYLSILKLSFRAPNVILHHRNGSYIRRRDPLIEVIQALVPCAHHVFLDTTMRDAYSRMYGENQRSLVITNALFSDVPIRPPSQSRTTLPVHVGYIGNLCEAKGFPDFVQAVQLLDPAMLRVHIAGSAVDEAGCQALDNILQNPSHNVTYWGRLSKTQKAQFFDAVDIVVLPTRFYAEAQPNVAVEAAAMGCCLITTDYAFVADVTDSEATVVIPSHQAGPESIAEAIRCLAYKAFERDVREKQTKAVASAKRRDLKALLSLLSELTD